MTKPSKGKEQVRCYYCKVEIRKDTVKRHCKGIHPGKEAKFSPLESVPVNYDYKPMTDFMEEVQKVSDHESNMMSDGTMNEDNEEQRSDPTTGSDLSTRNDPTTGRDLVI